jgi:hypothetical protein
VRFEIAGEGVGPVEYNVYVVRGGTVLHLYLWGTALDERDLARIATKAGAKLDAATK